MAQQIQVCDVKQNLVTIPPWKNRGTTEYVWACALQLEGNWQKHGSYIELLESTGFKVSGECHLKAEEHPYIGHFVVGLAKHHNMGNVKTELSPPDKENEEDFTNHLPGIMIPIDLGLCDDEYVKFSLTSAEPYWKMQKGLIIYGVTFTYI